MKNIPEFPNFQLDSKGNLFSKKDGSPVPWNKVGKIEKLDREKYNVFNVPLGCKS